MNTIRCSHCGAMARKRSRDIARSKWPLGPLYCSHACAGLARRDPNPPTPAQKKEAKRLYDAKRRAEKASEINAQKRAHYQANRDRLLKEHAAYRTANMHRHVEYCRRPEYRAYKSDYDRAHRAKKNFWDFAEAFLLLQDIEKEIGTRASRYEVYLQNGTINKAQTRRRAL